MRFSAICLALAFLIPASLNAEEDILSTAAANGQFKTLVNLVVAANLDEVLQAKGSFTVFAPTDEAFAKLPKGTLDTLLKPENRDQLANILKYHVLPQEIPVARRAPSHRLKSATTLLGKKLKFDRSKGYLRVNNAKVVIRNIKCKNGLIQVIDGVLLPPKEDDKSIVGTAAKAGKFKTLLAAVQAADLGEALSGTGPLTVFAPTDEAFKALPKGTLEKLLKPSGKSQLQQILKYHVVSGKITARDAVKAGEAKTLSGEKVKIRIDNGRLQINKSGVITNDVETSNGIIHIIDKVLLPPSLSDPKSNERHTSTPSKKEVTITAGWDKSINRDGIQTDRLVIRCNAAGKVRLTNVRAKEIVTRISGGGSVSISGKTDSHQATVNGGATLFAKELQTSETQIQVNGGGDAIVNASKLLKASASSGATLRYVKSAAKIIKQINKYANFSPVSTK